MYVCMSVCMYVDKSKRIYTQNITELSKPIGPRIINKKVSRRTLNRRFRLIASSARCPMALSPLVAAVPDFPRARGARNKIWKISPARRPFLTEQYSVLIAMVTSTIELASNIQCIWVAVSVFHNGNFLEYAEATVSFWLHWFACSHCAPFNFRWWIESIFPYVGGEGSIVLLLRETKRRHVVPPSCFEGVGGATIITNSSVVVVQFCLVDDGLS